MDGRSFYVLQILTIWIAWRNAVEEAAWSLPFRHISFDGKSELLNVAHSSGFQGSVGWAIGFAVSCSVFTGYTLWLKLCLVLLSGCVFGTWYWAAFDTLYAHYIGEKWYYLGQSADTDNWLIKHFGANGGRKKFTYCIIVLVILNAGWIAINVLVKS